MVKARERAVCERLFVALCRVATLTQDGFHPLIRSGDEIVLILLGHFGIILVIIICIIGASAKIDGDDRVGSNPVVNAHVRSRQVYPRFQPWNHTMAALGCKPVVTDECC
jgi:hypothetical protein